MSAVPEKPDAAFLSAVLRDPSRWPAGFEWNYTSCDTCALGLMGALVGNPEYNRSDAIDDFKLSGTESYDIFCRAHVSLGKRMRHVTPTDVADALDSVLAAQSIQS